MDFVNNTKPNVLPDINIAPDPEILGYFQCVVGSELPESGIDCSRRNLTFCVKCEINGAYLTAPFGELILQVLLVFSIILGVCGVFTNLVISCVLRKRKTKRTVDFLLLTLASADFLSCFSSIFVCVAPLLHMSNLVNISLVMFF